MKKLIFVFISVLLLASCDQVQNVGANVSASPDVTVEKAIQTPLRTFSVVSTSPSPTYEYTSCKQGESVSEYFYTGDLEQFFTISSDELCNMFGNDYEHSSGDQVYRPYTAYDMYNYNRLGVSFLYRLEELDDGYVGFRDVPEASLQIITLSDFDFRDLNEASNFNDVINTLGESKLLTIRREDHYGEGYYYYALRYIFGDLRFEFSSQDEKGAGGLTLAISPSSESKVFYTSCKKGESLSKTLATGDIKLFFEFAPEDLDSRIGNGNPTDDDDFGNYYIYFEYLGVLIAYDIGYLGDTSHDYIAYPKPPVQFVHIDDFEYHGLTDASSFKEVMKKLGNAKVYTEEYDGVWYFIQYNIDGMVFKFSSREDDEQASNGVSLSIYPS